MIWFVRPGSGSRIRILIFSHPGPRIKKSKGTGSRIHNTGHRENCEISTPLCELPGSEVFGILSVAQGYLGKYDPVCSSRIRIPDPDPDFYPSGIPDPGVKMAPDPGSGSATVATEKIVKYTPDSASWLAATEKEEKGSICRPRSSRLRLLSGSGVDTHSTTMSQPPLRFSAKYKQWTK
jgi:hypothetical protein